MGIVLDTAHFAGQCLVGITFVVSGFMHWANQLAFYESILKYRLVPSSVALYVAWLLPFVLLVTGVWLCMGVFKTTVRRITSVVLAMFVLVQASAFARGLSIDCGCYGTHSELISLKSISWVVFLFAVSCFVLFLAPRESNDES